MRIVERKKIKEACTTNDIVDMIDNGELGMFCDDLLDGLSEAVFQIKETDKLVNFFTKYPRSAASYASAIETVSGILYSAKKKGWMMNYKLGAEEVWELLKR